ncbi:hypothetical protein C8R44DRAFT_861999 [Mycena epipterygia]|nr:hypothetical protein C8R44DRAFT_861999 [Mycena epipterygia]
MTMTKLGACSIAAFSIPALTLVIFSELNPTQAASILEKVVPPCFGQGCRVVGGLFVDSEERSHEVLEWTLEEHGWTTFTPFSDSQLAGFGSIIMRQWDLDKRGDYACSVTYAAPKNLGNLE